MKLKSLKLALKVFDVCLKKHKHLINCAKDDEDYNIGMEAYKDIKRCVNLLEKQIKELEEMDTTDIMGTGWTFPIMIDAEYSMEYLKKKVKIFI